MIYMYLLTFLIFQTLSFWSLRELLVPFLMPEPTSHKAHLSYQDWYSAQSLLSRDQKYKAPIIPQLGILYFL